MTDFSTKYPRTYHLPFSKGLTNDDKMVDDDWEKYIINQPIVITEKLDGSNSCITKYGVYARSHSSFTENKWDTNLIENGGLYDKIKNDLSDNMYIYGENMYAIHSIEYNKLPSYFFMFAYRNENIFETWDNTQVMSIYLDIPLVPVLFEGTVKSVKELENMINAMIKNGSLYGNTIEGVVVRNKNKFYYNDFNKYVVKYVREHHVQTDEHWKRNWKRAKLIYEYNNIIIWKNI
jgi:tRNA splicing ligase